MFQRLSALLVFAVVLAHPSYSQEGFGEEAQGQLLGRILKAADSINTVDPRKVNADCVALGRELEAIAGVEDLGRLYLEAEIERCKFYAKDEGKFSDDSGDACTHHYAFASKFSQIIKGGVGKPHFAGSLMQTLGERLQQATENGPKAGCKQDYGAFSEAIGIAVANSDPPPPPAYRALLGAIGNVKYELTPENAKTIQRKCFSFVSDIATTVLTPMERHYAEALVQDCAARAKSTGQYSDELGDVCAHHFNFAVKLAEGIAAGRAEPPHPDRLQDIMQGELETAKRQGPGMGCKQDYSSLG